MRKLRRSSAGAGLDLALALVALGGTTLLFRLGGQRAVARVTDNAISVTPATDTDAGARQVEVLRACRAVRRTKRIWPSEILCLQTALVLQWVLHRHHIPAAVRLGVRREEGDLQAHAWVETGGYVLEDGRGYQVFTPLSPRSRPNQRED